MKLAIIGSRDFTDQDRADEVFKTHFCRWLEFTENDHQTHDHFESKASEIVSGGARGADSVGASIAKKWGLKLTEYMPDWEKYGKRAGFVRNEDIIKNADMVLAFWDGESRGTGNSLSIAKRLKKPTLIIYV